MGSVMELLPSPDLMYRALRDRDASFEGIFVAGIRTTGIFCRPTCSAKKPQPQNVEFFGSASDRKSTRLNSSHANISYAVFCLIKKISEEVDLRCVELALRQLYK